MDGMNFCRKVSSLWIIALLVLSCLLSGAAAESGQSPEIAWEWDAEPFAEDAEILTLWVTPMVGADCMLLTFGEHTMLVDVGDRTTTKQVSAMLELAGVESVEYVFGTHPHADHMGGIFAMLERGFGIGAYINFFPHDYYEGKQNVIQRQVIEAVETTGVPILDMHTEDTIPFGDVTLTAYRIPDDWIDKSLTCNNLSAMLMVQYGDCSMLLTADVEGRAQGILVELYDLDADIMKFPHHGLNKADETFLREISPAFTFFTNGSDRPKGARNQLSKDGYPWMTFASWGTIVLRTDGHRWTVRQDFTKEILKHAIKTFNLDPTLFE